MTSRQAFGTAVTGDTTPVTLGFNLRNIGQHDALMQILPEGAVLAHGRAGEGTNYRPVAGVRERDFGYRAVALTQAQVPAFLTALQQGGFTEEVYTILPRAIVPVEGFGAARPRVA
jgi:hypothetical protein